MKIFIKLLTVFLLLVALAACDPISYPYHTVDRIAAHENGLYTRAIERKSMGIGYTPEASPQYFISESTGKKWGSIEAVPPAVEQLWAQEPVYPKIACWPSQPDVCYQITGDRRIDLSTDAGKTWKKAWSFPLGREGFIIRNPRYFLLSPGSDDGEIEPDTAPKDIAILESGNTVIVAAALGNQGIIIQDETGNWERVAVGRAEPLPYRATTLNEIWDYLFGELALAACSSVFLLLILAAFYAVRRTTLLPWITPWLVFTAITLPFILWIYGVIPIYQIALVLAAILCGGILVWGYFKAWQPNER